MARIVVLVDGFNLYHALEDVPSYHKYKWLDLSKLARLFVTRKDSIEAIYYFTALTHWNPEKVERHKIFIRALELRSVSVVYGEFRKKDRNCPLCHRAYRTHEEKQTNVNIAITLFRLAINDRFDTALIVSGDSDLIPSIRAVRATFPMKRIGVVIPVGRRAEELKQVCDYYMKMKERHLQASLLEDEIELGDSLRLSRPPGWH